MASDDIGCGELPINLQNQPFFQKFFQLYDSIKFFVPKSTQRWCQIKTHSKSYTKPIWFSIL